MSFAQPERGRVERRLKPNRDFHDHWYYCVTCQRVWHAATWRLLGWACPSGAHESWPEFHPHIGWSHVRHRAGGVSPGEGRHVELLPARNEPQLPAAG